MRPGMWRIAAVHLLEAPDNSRRLGEPMGLVDIRAAVARRGGTGSRHRVQQQGRRDHRPGGTMRLLVTCLLRLADGASPRERCELSAHRIGRRRRPNRRHLAYCRRRSVAATGNRLRRRRLLRGWGDSRAAPGDRAVRVNRIAIRRGNDDCRLQSAIATCSGIATIRPVAAGSRLASDRDWSRDDKLFFGSPGYTAILDVRTSGGRIRCCPWTARPGPSRLRFVAGPCCGFCAKDSITS